MKVPFFISFLLHFTVVITALFTIKQDRSIEKNYLYADLIRSEQQIEEKHPKTLPFPKSETKTTKGNQKTARAFGPKQQAFDGKKTSPPTDHKMKPTDNTTIKGNDGIDTDIPKTEDTIASSPPKVSTPLKQNETETTSFRDKLFDKEIIRGLAKAERSTPDRDGSITFDTKELKYHSYLRRLRERIEGVWRYPTLAAERGIYGDLYIRFTINKNGSLGQVELVRTSGHKILDDAAMKALRDANPFWPVPDEISKDTFTITGHFVYSIYGTYLR